MLLAVEQHPAMLLLPRQPPVDRPAPPRGGAATASAGLNENLAREILELHTLGVDGGYTQADVTSLAAHHHRLDGGLAGRRPAARRRASPSAPARHEPGEHDGARQALCARAASDQGEAVLRDLAAPSGDGAASSPASWRAISSPTSRRQRWWSGWRRPSCDSEGDLAAVTRGAGAARRRRGRRPPPSCGRRRTSLSPAAGDRQDA